MAMAKGFVYLTAVVDVASCKVLSQKVAITLKACHTVETFQEVFAKFGEPEIVNTEQGSHGAATQFTTALLDQGCKLSMDGKGGWRDNVFVEHAWRSVKYERLYLKAYDAVSTVSRHYRLLWLVQLAKAKLKTGQADARQSLSG